MLRAVSIIVALALHTIFVTVRSRLSTYLPHPAPVRQPLFPPLPHLLDFCALPATVAPDFFPRAPIFFRPFARAAKRRKNAIPFCRARISGRSLRRFGSGFHPPPTLPSAPSPFVPSLSLHRQASTGERVFFSISILCSRDERRVLAAIARESPLDGDACDHVYLIDERAKDGCSIRARETALAR